MSSTKYFGAPSFGKGINNIDKKNKACSNQITATAELVCLFVSEATFQVKTGSVSRLRKGAGSNFKGARSIPLPVSHSDGICDRNLTRL